MPGLVPWLQTSLIPADLPGHQWFAGLMCLPSPDLLCTVGLCPFLARTLHLPTLLWPTCLWSRLSCCSLASHTCLHQSLCLPSFNYTKRSRNLWLTSIGTSACLSCRSLKNHIFNWLTINFVFPIFQLPRLKGCRLYELLHNKMDWNPVAKDSSFVYALKQGKYPDGSMCRCASLGLFPPIDIHLNSH